MSQSRTLGNNDFENICILLSKNIFWVDDYLLIKKIIKRFSIYFTVSLKCISLKTL